MKMTNAFVYLIPFCLVIFDSGCTARPDCEVLEFGTLEINNTSTNPYDIWINSEYTGRFSGGEIQEFSEMDKGNYNLQAEQVSGYLLYPTVVNSQKYITECERVSWVFP